jgi:hypothetical protein
MASQFVKNPGEPHEDSCLHPRLVLETTPTGYLTGEYICEECGRQFHSPASKHSAEQENGNQPNLFD